MSKPQLLFGVGAVLLVVGFVVLVWQSMSGAPQLVQLLGGGPMVLGLGMIRHASVVEERQRQALADRLADEIRGGAGG